MGLGGEEERPTGTNLWMCEVEEGLSEFAGGAWVGLMSQVVMEGVEKVQNFG